MNPSWLSLLGMARRARRLAPGSNAVLQSIRDKKAYLVLIASDISPKTAANIRFAAERQDIPVCMLPCTLEQLSSAIGIRAGLVALEDAGFARAALKKIPSHAENTKEEPSL